MRISPIIIGVSYLLMGLFFLYLAVLYKTDTVWNAASIIFTLIATLDIGIALKILTGRHKLFNKDSK